MTATDIPERFRQAADAVRELPNLPPEVLPLFAEWLAGIGTKADMIRRAGADLRVMIDPRLIALADAINANRADRP